DAAPDTRPTGGLGTPVPHLPLERDDASSSWDEESEVTDECLTAIAAEAARASRASDPFLLVTPRARKSPPHLREPAAAASARPARLPPPSAAASAPRASRPSFSRVPPCLPPHVAAPLDATDPDEADTLPVPVRAPAVAAKTSTPAPLRPFARTTADPVSPPL